LKEKLKKQFKFLFCVFITLIHYIIGKLNLPIETDFYKSLVSNKKIKSKSIFKPSFSVFRRLLEKYSKYRQLWQKAIETGKSDGSIKSDLDSFHLNFIIIMIIFGIIEQVGLRPIILNDVGLKKEKVVDITLKIIEKLLNNEI